MNDATFKKSWLTRNWKWAFPVIVIILVATTFFSLTGNATLRFGSVYLQPDLIENAWMQAKENDRVIEKLGELQRPDFFRLLEGEVHYTNDDKTVTITVGVIGSKGRAKLDILAHLKQDTWEYEKITFRIKKPEKETIKILEK